MMNTFPTMPKTKAAPKSLQQAQALLAHEQAEPLLLRHLRTPEGARYLGVSVSFLNHARLRGTGPTYKKLSPKLIVYSIGDLQAWADSKNRRSTSGSRPSQT